MSGKSSIHVKAVKSGSERHNERQQDLNYVRKDLTPENESFQLMKIAEARTLIEERYRASTGQKMQAKATPIREGVLLISKEHGIEDLKVLAQKLEDRFGIKTIQAYTHKDEGHYDKETQEWKPNYHAHMVFDWTDAKTGKNLNLTRDDMSEMQTIVAESLDLERGVKSSKKHIDAMAYKAIEMEKDLEKLVEVKNAIPTAIQIVKNAEELQSEIKDLEDSKKTLKVEIFDSYSLLEQYKKDLELRPIVEKEIKDKKTELSILQGSNRAIQIQISDNSELLERIKKELDEKQKQAEKLVELEKSQKEIEQKIKEQKNDFNLGREKKQ